MVGFPLLLIPLAICNIIVFLMPGVAFDAPVVSLAMWSGNRWTPTLGDLLLAGGMLLLLLEIIKSARGGKYLTDHLLALLVFGGAAAEFVLLPQFATSTFFLLTMLALVDVLAGIALRRGRRRQVAYAEPAAATIVAPAATPPAPAVVTAPLTPSDATPVETVPAAASVAEAVLLDRPEPVTATPALTADGSPQIASPDLQPVNDPHSPDKPR